MAKEGRYLQCSSQRRGQEKRSVCKGQHSYIWRSGEVKALSSLTDCKEVYRKRTAIERGRLLEEIKGCRLCTSCLHLSKYEYCKALMTKVKEGGSSCRKHRCGREKQRGRLSRASPTTGMQGLNQRAYLQYTKCQ